MNRRRVFRAAVERTAAASAKIAFPGLIGLVPALAILVTTAPAQPLASNLPPHHVRLEGNSAGMFGIGIDYGRRIDDALGARDIYLTGSVGLPLLSPDQFRAGLDLGADLTSFGWVRLWSRAQLNLTTAHNDVGDFVALGVGLDVIPYLRFDRWSIGVNLGTRQQLATHIRHSRLVRRTFEDRYADGTTTSEANSGPADGWYSLTARRWMIGLEGSVRLGRAWLLDAAGGAVFTSQPFDASSEGMIGLLPFYGRLGCACYF